MAMGLLGKKVGMTQIFTPEGEAVPVTVLQVGPCTVTQIKTKETDGYTAVQIGFDPTLEKRITKPERGHLQKHGIQELLRHLREFKVEKAEDYQLGQTLDVSIFQEGQLVDVAGTSIGHGFAGNQKRHNFGRGPMSHGSKNHRLPGSIGAGTTPGRVFPGTRMAGRDGGKRATTRKLKIVRTDLERNLILVKGSVPGVEGGLLEIRPTKVFGKQQA
jgi:large subunit ribosomal protein L3